MNRKYLLKVVAVGLISAIPISLILFWVERQNDMELALYVLTFSFVVIVALIIPIVLPQRNKAKEGQKK
jgi:membrane protein YdbS with pleckstrin-like domain